MHWLFLWVSLTKAVHAGDLHFYMRHSFKPAPAAPPAAELPPRPASRAHAAGARLEPERRREHLPFAAEASPQLARHAAAAAAQLRAPASASSVASSTDLDIGPDLYTDLSRFVDHGTAILPFPCMPSALPQVAFGDTLSRQKQREKTCDSSGRHGCSTAGIVSWALSLCCHAACEANSRAVAAAAGVTVAGASAAANLHPHDPEHLIVNGLVCARPPYA